MFDTIAILLAAGTGSRMGLSRPKQFARLGGRTILHRAAAALQPLPTLVVTGAGDVNDVRQMLSSLAPLDVIPGGTERQLSVAAALDWIDTHGGARHVFVHDAARPLLPPEVLDRLKNAVKGHQGAIPALAVSDTLAASDGLLGPVTDRTGLVRVQTPQLFRFEALLAAHATWKGGLATDDAQMVRAAGGSVAVVEGHPMLDKITHPGDLEQAARWLPRETRVGTGFDVHRLAEGEEMWLCGVRVPGPVGLAGHSDADVGLHAVVDAILGALALGDIGQHFPPSDPQWRGARSSRFVAHACALAAEHGADIRHIDVSLICETPKIGPHRDAMRAALAGMLGVPVERISVKATTTERLGFTGRGEGIAAQAVATLSLAS